MVDKLALVTGGATPSGIGYASAKALLKLGYEVIVTGISEAEIAQTPALPGLSLRVLDVTSETSIASLISSLPRLDALVNCAGAAGAHEFEITNFARTIDINLTGTMRVCMAAHPLLARQGGAIVNLGSMTSIFGSPVAPAYAASKGGVMQLTRSLAGAWAKENIRVNAVAPGYIRTNLARVVWEDDAQEAGIITRTPMGRWGEGSDVGDVIGFLCAPESRFVTGTLIPVDGGYSIIG